MANASVTSAIPVVSSGPEVEQEVIAAVIAHSVNNLGYFMYLLNKKHNPQMYVIFIRFPNVQKTQIGTKVAILVPICVCFVLDLSASEPVMLQGLKPVWPSPFQPWKCLP